MINNYLRSAVAVLATSPLAALAYTTVPQAGMVNMEEYPGGVNSVEVEGNFSINRSAEGYASLYRDNELLRQIPASNRANLYTFQGLDKTETGAVHITFFQPSGAARNSGSYRVEIPEGFFTDLATGEPTEAQSYSWTISGSGGEILPAPGSYLSLHEFRIPLPAEVGGKEVTNYRVSGSATIESLRDELSEVNEMTTTTTVEGTEAVIRLEWEVTTPDTYILNVPRGLVTATSNGGTWQNPKGEYSYVVMNDSKNGVIILPLPGEYEEFAPQHYADASGLEFDYTFLISVPEEDPIKYALMGQAKLYPMNEDGTYDTATNAGAFRAVKKSDTLLALVPTTGADKVISPAPGRYALEIPKGMYQTAAGQNGTYWFEYTVIANSSLPYTIEPAAGNAVTQLQRITLTFDEGMEVSCQSNSYATLTNGIAVYTLDPEVSAEQPNVVVFSLPIPMTDEGEWVFTTPDYNFSVSGRMFAMTAFYTVTKTLVGVGAAEAESPVVALYRLDGTRVATGANAGALAPGLYIAIDASGRARKLAVR